MLLRRWLLVVFLLCLIGPLRAEVPVDLGSVTEKHVMVPMRDGTKLSTYLYFPEGKDPWAVLYEQRYADLRAAETRKAFARLAAAGYVVAAQNFRGTHLSEGTWVGYRALGWGEQKDGFDTVEWLAGQPWSTGKVGTFGGSQAGFAQNFLAVTQPPHLVCQYMIDTGLSLFQEGYRIGGTTRPERFKQMEAVCRNPEDNRRLVKEWFAHATYDDYWAAEDCTRHFDKMNVPCFTVGSWYDYMCVGSVESFIGRQHRGGTRSRGRQQLLIGPWLHGRLKDTNKVGDLAYPENARFALEQHMVRWFDHHLKGRDNGVGKDPAVRYYVMGAAGEPGAPGNDWRTAGDWPVPVQSVAHYLHEGGKLSTRPPEQAESGTTFLADPTRPATVPGRAFPGARDARDFEKQAEVRTFTSEVLTEPIEWTGKVRAELWVSSTARDTDLIVRLSDVYPDGRSILIMDYVRRARYREGYEKEVLLEPGKVCKVAFDVGWLSQVFNKGHRIRVTVAGTGAPFYEINPNTGEPLTAEPPARTVAARNTVHHNRQFASCILAPMVRLNEKGTQGPSRDSVGVVNRKTLSAETIECDRIAVGEPDDYKPCIAMLPSGELLMTAFHQHKREGNKVREQNLLFRSQDGGRTWSRPENLDLLGREPYLTVLQDGTLFMTGHLLANDVRNKHGYIHGYLHRSADGGKSWGSVRIESEGIKPRAANHSTRNVLQLADGTLLLGVDYDGGDGPYLMWRSRDGGKTWNKTQKCEPRDFKSKYGFFGGETWLWQARSGKIWALVRVDSDELPIKDRPIQSKNDQSDHFILFSSTDEGRTFNRIRDFGDYGEMYMSILRLQDKRLLLTFTVRDLHPPLGVRAIPGLETEDGFDFDFSSDRLLLDTRTPVGKSQGGGFGPTVQLKDGTLVTSYSYRGSDDKTHLEVIRWKMPTAR